MNRRTFPQKKKKGHHHHRVQPIVNECQRYCQYRQLIANTTSQQRMSKIQSIYITVISKHSQSAMNVKDTISIYNSQ